MSFDFEIDARTVFYAVGGQPLQVYQADSIANGNACALRVSLALNASGVNIPETPGKTLKGSNGKNYFLSVAMLHNFLMQTFGNPTKNLSSSDGNPNGFGFGIHLQNKKGIFLMKAQNRFLFGAKGHASVWNGSNCPSYHSYFDAAGGVHFVKLWVLP